MLLPTGKKAIGCCWVFAVKFNPVGSGARLKARLGSKGYAHTYGVGHSDTFSSVAKMTYVRLFISMATTHSWDIHKFIWSNLQGLLLRGESVRVCRLRKSLYDLK